MSILIKSLMVLTAIACPVPAYCFTIQPNSEDRARHEIRSIQWVKDVITGNTKLLICDVNDVSQCESEPLCGRALTDSELDRISAWIKSDNFNNKLAGASVGGLLGIGMVALYVSSVPVSGGATLIPGLIIIAGTGSFLGLRASDSAATNNQILEGIRSGKIVSYSGSMAEAIQYIESKCPRH
jgi:hypothetical protein